jgi:hypothetical protein
LEINVLRQMLSQRVEIVDKFARTNERVPVETMWLTVHALWVLWMVSGVVIAVLGYWHHRLWRMAIFRTAHVIGIVATATVPIWNDGRCPITDWESTSSGQALDPFMIRLWRALVYWDISPMVLGLVSAGAAILTVAIYLHHPPARISQLHRTSSKVGRKMATRD